MKSNLLIAAGVGILFLLPQASFGQTESSSPADVTSSHSDVVNPHAVMNNSLATGGGAGMNSPSQWGRANAVYVEHEIQKAKANGKDVTVAETQRRMGMTALNNGLNKEAAQHFDTALRSIGIEPKAQGQNPGEPEGGHSAMPGQTKP